MALATTASRSPMISIPSRAAAAAHFPPTSPLVRSIHCCLWTSALEQFDGHVPVCVYKLRTPQGKWLYTIELHEGVAKCVTRLNGEILHAIHTSRFTS